MSREDRQPQPEIDRTCRHCGVQGRMRQRGDVVIKQEVEGDFHRGGIVYDTVVAVYTCQACEEPTVWAYERSRNLFETYGEQRLYPTVRDNSSLPPKVGQRLDAAAKVKKVDPDSYAVAIRRMLETVCNEEQAAGTDLFAKLDDLAAHGRVPGPLADVAHQLRELGNLGAHDKDVEVALEDVPVIEALADAILEYLYRAPGQLSAVQRRLEERQQAAPPG